MHADLERLIHLQAVETASAEARRAIADEPTRHQELDARLAAARQTLEHERARLAANQVARRDIEKELATHQGRLSKYKDQLMAVKTNREYQAMQKEMETAQHEIGVFEERMLERMLEFDDVTAAVKTAEKAFADEQQAIEAERRTIGTAVNAARAAIERLAAERADLASHVPPALMVTFDKLIKHRGGQAVSQVVDGRCITCQVRIRHQVYNDLKQHQTLFQCESCQRILYVPLAATGTT